jgi:hypothetical protein
MLGFCGDFTLSRKILDPKPENSVTAAEPLQWRAVTTPLNSFQLNRDPKPQKFV